MIDKALEPILNFLHISYDQLREEMGRKTNLSLTDIPAYARQFEDGAAGTVKSLGIARSQKRLYLGVLDYDDGRLFRVCGATLNTLPIPEKPIKGHAVTVSNSGLGEAILKGILDPVGCRLSDLMAIPTFILDVRVDSIRQIPAGGQVTIYDWARAYEEAGKQNALWTA